VRECFNSRLPPLPLSHILETSGLGVTHSVDCMHTVLCGVLVMHLHVLRLFYLDC
jgi:hypothetical protein